MTLRRRPRLLRLEDRLTPAIATWDGGGPNEFWTTPANWAGDVLPQENDDLAFPAGAAQLTNINDFPLTAFNSISISGNGYQISGTGITLAAGIVGNNANGSAIDLDIVLTAPQVFANTAGSGFAISGDIDLNGQILTATINGGTPGGGPIPLGPGIVALSGEVKGSGGIIKDGVQILLLSGDNTFVGPIDHRAGTLNFFSNNAAGATGATNQTQVEPDAVLTVADGLTIPESITFANSNPANQGQLAVGNTAVTFTGPVTLTGNSRWLGEIVLAGGLFGTGALSVQGSLTFPAGAVSTYNGTLNAETRFFLFNGTGPTGLVTANDSQRVSGVGSIGPLTVQGSTRFAPGNSGTATAVGTLTTGNLIEGAFFDADLTATGNDMVAVTGTVTLAGTLNVIPEAGFTLPDNSVFRIINNDGTDAVAGRFANLPQAAVATTINGVALYINYFGGNGNDVELTTTQPLPPPEAQPFYSVGAGPGGGPQVNVYNEAGGLIRAFLAYDGAFRGGVHVATADVTGDGVRDVITAPGFGGGPVVRIWDGITGAMVIEYNAYDPAFRGGVFVAAARIDSDIVSDVVTGAGQTGGPHVKVFNGPTSTVINQFLAYDPAFTGGVRVAAIDGLIVHTNINPGIIVTGAGIGGGPHVRTWGGTTGTPQLSFFAYESSFTGGVFVAGGRPAGLIVTPDNEFNIVVTPGAGRSAQVRIFNAVGAPDTLFLAYNAAFQGGATVAVRPGFDFGVIGVITGAGPGGGPHVKEFGTTGTSTPSRSFFAFDPAFLGGVFVG